MTLEEKNWKGIIFLKKRKKKFVNLKKKKKNASLFSKESNGSKSSFTFEDPTWL
jgi:hypothetical protein